MTADLLIPLAGLALLDSTSFGTLLIPLWLLMAPGRLRPHRVLAFLGTVGLYYLALGVALLAGATRLADALSGFLDSPAAGWAQLALGVGLFVLSFRIGKKTVEPAQAREPAPVSTSAHPRADDVPLNPAGAAPAGEQPRPGRAARWRARAMSGDGGSLAALLGLALAAAGLETVSMVPYLSAIGLLTASDLSWASGVVVLAGYCLVMITPALVLLVLRVVAHRWVRGPLERLEAWLTRTAAETTAWVVGIVGFLLARDALVRTGLLDQVLGG